MSAERRGDISLFSFLEMMEGGEGEPETGFRELWDRARFADFGLGLSDGS